MSPPEGANLNHQDAVRKSPINPRLIVFLFALFLTEFSRSMTLVQIPIFLRELGASIQEVGFFFTVALIFPLLLRILGGWISDTLGRLPSLVAGSVAGVLGYLVYFLSPSWQLALLAPVFLAITSALIFPSYQAYIADHTPEEMQGRIFGFTEMVISVAWIFGPPIGGMIAIWGNYSLMLIIAASAFGFATSIFLILFKTLPTDQRQATEGVSFASFRSTLRQMFILMLSGGLVTWILIVDGVRDIAFKMSFDLMPIYLSEMANFTKSEIGLLDGLSGISIALTTLPAGWLIDKTSERVGITIGLIVMILSRLVFALADSYLGFALSWALLGIGGGFLSPAGSSLIAKGVPIRVRGLTYGLVATSLGFLSLPAPWIGSQVWNAVNPRAPFLMTVVVAAVVIIPAWFKLVVESKHWVGVEVSRRSLFHRVRG